MIEVLIAGAVLVIQQVLHSRERQTLLDRIQAPEKVLAERSPEPSDEILFVPAEDDDAYEDFIDRRRAGEVV